MTKTLRRYLQLVCCLLMQVALTACTSFEGPDVESSSNSQISFKFKIKSDQLTNTRALGVWEESAVNVAERILDASDMRILVFNNEDYRQLVANVIPSMLEYDTDKGYYHLSADFSCDYFDSFADNADVPFTVMILANLEAAGGKYTTYPEISTTIENVRETFTISSDYYPTPERGIPMYGCRSIVLNKSKMLNPDINDEGIEFNLIRSLCKVEVTDNIVNSSTASDGLKYPRVTNVEMISWNDRANLRPLYIYDYVTTLREPNILKSVSNTAVSGNFTDNRFRFYCPEADMDDMKFRVSAILEPGGETKFYEVTLDKFPEIGSKMVRNHIYRFEVEAVGTLANLNVTVDEWTRVVDEYDLDNVVSMDSDGYLTWSYDEANFAISTETYNGREEQQLSILNATSSYATGRFKISSPRGATWKAYFIPGENGVDAFEFVNVDKDGNVLEGSGSVVAEGVVGEQATIYIRGKGAADAYRHWAELVIEVHTVDGIILLAPLTRTSSRYIIYRENKM